MSEENKETQETQGAMRMNAVAALHVEAERLEAKASFLRKLAREVDGILTDDADLALWGLLMNAPR